jgi:hypothetical protein
VSRQAAHHRHKYAIARARLLDRRGSINVNAFTGRMAPTEALCSQVNVYRTFGGTYRLHLQPMASAHCWSLSSLTFLRNVRRVSSDYMVLHRTSCISVASSCEIQYETANRQTVHHWMARWWPNYELARCGWIGPGLINITSQHFLEETKQSHETPQLRQRVTQAEIRTRNFSVKVHSVTGRPACLLSHCLLVSRLRKATASCGSGFSSRSS